MAELKCNMCGGKLVHISNNTYICEYCETPTVRTNTDSNNKSLDRMKEKAHELYLKCDFDAASAIYQSIVIEDSEDSESYWHLVLCEYGIEYVDDIKTGKKIPTCHRTSYTSVFNNDNYLNALECSDIMARNSYEKSAHIIDNLQRSILSIVSNAEPYDVFISYKQTEIDGSITKESTIAQDLYYKLSAEGYRTFFAPVTLQEKAGMEYEPFIFAALNSAKIMFVIGYSEEHFNAVWVKNEWSRFLERKNKNPRLILLPCYNSLLNDAKIIPAILREKIQARDLANASTNDLLAEVKSKLQPKVAKSSNNTNAFSSETYLKRANMFLEDKDWSHANEYFEKTLDIDPECSSAYVGKLKVELSCSSDDDLIKYSTTLLNQSPHWKRALIYASPSYQQKLQQIEKKQYRTYYDKLVYELLDSADNDDWDEVENLLSRIPDRYCEESEKVKLDLANVREEQQKLRQQERIRVAENTRKYNIRMFRKGLWNETIIACLIMFISVIIGAIIGSIANINNAYYVLTPIMAIGGLYTANRFNKYAKANAKKGYIYAFVSVSVYIVVMIWIIHKISNL